MIISVRAGNTHNKQEIQRNFLKLIKASTIKPITNIRINGERLYALPLIRKKARK